MEEYKTSEMVHVANVNQDPFDVTYNRRTFAFYRQAE